MKKEYVLDFGKCIKCKTNHKWDRDTFCFGNDWILRLNIALCPTCREEFSRFLSVVPVEARNQSYVWILLYQEINGPALCEGPRN